MIALDPAIIIEFSTTLARAKLDALNVLRAMIAAPADDAALPAPHQRLAATQILRTTFITHSARNNMSPSPWEGAGGRDTKSAHLSINHPAAIEARTPTTSAETARTPISPSPWEGAGGRDTKRAHQPINHPATIEARTSTTSAESPRNQISPSPWEGAGGRDTKSALPPLTDPATIHPNDIDELAQRLTPEQLLDLIESLPGGTVLGDSPEEQANINARLLQALNAAREQPRGPPRPR